MKVSLKLILSTIFILFFCISFNSCEKCTRCTYPYYEVDPENRKSYSQQECGNQEDVEQFQEAAQYAAQQFDTTATCVSW